MKRIFKRLIDLLSDRENQIRYLKWLGKNTKPFIPIMIIILIFDILGSLIGLGSTFVSKFVVDSATSSDTRFINGFILMVSVSVASTVIGALTTIFGTYIGERFSFGIRINIYEHILRADWLRLSKFHSGDLLTRLTSDVDTVCSGIATIIPTFITTIIRLGASLIILWHYSWQLTLCALLLVPVGIIVTLIYGEPYKKLQVEVKESEAKYRSFLQESIANITVIKTMQSEKDNCVKLKELRRNRLKLILKRNRMSVYMNISIRFVYMFGYFAAFGVGLFGLYNGNLTYGTMTLLISMVSQVQGPIMGLSGIVGQIISILASAGRLMTTDEIAAENDTKETFKTEKIGLKFNDVSFVYSGDENFIFKKFDYMINPGDRIGIIGTSGVGKTTFIRLVLALCNPQTGNIDFISDDGSIEKANAATRRHIAYVPQGNSLVSGTVRDNLLAGNPSADEKFMWEVLEICAAGDFLRKMPSGLDTKITEKAGGISEGQAQRISIARALIRQAPLLILDEATSALDEKTEEEILSKIQSSKEQPTALIITHRPSMLAYCTRAIEIREGEIYEIDIKKYQKTTIENI